MNFLVIENFSEAKIDKRTPEHLRAHNRYYRNKKRQSHDDQMHDIRKHLIATQKHKGSNVDLARKVHKLNHSTILFTKRNFDKKPKLP